MTKEVKRKKPPISDLHGQMGTHVCGLFATGGDLLTVTETAEVEPRDIIVCRVERLGCSHSSIASGLKAC